MKAREERIAKTESLFRSVNERIAEATERFDNGDATDAEFLCECGDPACSERLEVPLDEYEQVRDATGYEPGAVAPFPLEQVEAVFLDRSLLGHPLVWIGAGSTRHMAALAPTELMRLSRAEPMDAVEGRPEGPVHETDQERRA